MGHPGAYIILLRQFIGQPLGDLVQKFLTVHTAGLEAGLHQPQQIFCHHAVFQRLQGGILQRLAELSNSPRRFKPPDQAKMVAMGLVEVFSPFRYL